MKELLEYLDQEDSDYQAMRQELVALMKEKRLLLVQPSEQRAVSVSASSSFAAHVRQLNEQSSEVALGSYAMSLRGLHDATLNGKVLDLAIRESVQKLVKGVDQGQWKPGS